jgi:hypothetical protein
MGETRERNGIQGKGDNDTIRLVGTTKGPDYLFHATHTRVGRDVLQQFFLSFPLSPACNRTHEKKEKKEKIVAMNKTRDFVSFFFVGLFGFLLLLCGGGGAFRPSVRLGWIATARFLTSEKRIRKRKKNEVPAHT